MINERKRGISTIEMLIVIAIVGFLIILIAAIPNSIRLISRARHQSLVREIINKALETKRSIGYINLANGIQAINDQRLSSLPDGTGETLIEDCDALICTEDEDVKKVTVTINWNEAGSTKEETMVTFISDGGLN
jgi:Tfp pilus assembly protein FimT